MLRTIHQVPNSVVTYDDVCQAITNFFYQHKVRPTLIRMSFPDLTNYMKMMGHQVVTLEENKKYVNYAQSAFGPIQLGLMEDDGTQISVGYNQYNNGTTYQPHPLIVIIESDEIDREFEKHILNSENK